MKTYFMQKIGAFDYRNGWLKSNCPICGGELKLGIHLQQDRVHCFKCEYNNKPINLVMHLEDAKFIEAIAIIRGLEPGRYYEKPPEVYERAPAVLPNGFRLIDKSDSTILGIRAYKYAVSVRGLPYSTVKRLKLGYVKDVNSSHYNHLIIPFYKGRTLIYFQSRNMGDGIKFNNPTIEEFGIGKNSLIYNIDALQKYSEISIVESVLNAITIAPKVTSILSKSVSKYQLNVHNRAPVSIYNIILDPDAYGKALDLGLALVGRHKIRIVKMPWGMDVNDVGREFTEKAIANTPILDWKGLMALKNEYKQLKFRYETT